MMKVLHLASWYPNRISPLEGIFVKKHVDAIAEFCDVAVLYITFDSSLKDHPYLIEERNENGVLVIRIYLRTNAFRIPIISKIGILFRYCKAYYKGWKKIKQDFGMPEIINVDVVTRIGIAAILFKFIKHIPYVIIEHSTQYVQYKNRRDYFQHVSLLAHLANYCTYYFSNSIIAVSHYLMNAIKDIFKINAVYYVVPNVITIPLTVPKRPVSGGTIKMVTISNLTIEHKNIDNLILAFKKVVEKYTDVQLHIIGDGPDREQLHQLAYQIGLLERNIFFHGSVPNDQIDYYLSQAHFFVLNSRYETFSVATAEALAHGVPVIVTNCGGPEEFVDKEFGIIVDKDNENALVDGMEYMIKNWHQYNSLKLRLFSKSSFSSEVVGRVLFNIYSSILLTGKTP